MVIKAISEDDINSNLGTTTYKRSHNAVLLLDMVSFFVF